MATRLDDYVTITITRQTAGITAPGFGVPLILGYSAEWGDRLRYYQDLPSIAADGFTEDSPEYLAAEAVLSQSPSVVQLAIGRGATKPTLVHTVGVVAPVSALTAYSLTADGVGVTETTCSVTTTATPSAAQVNSGLVTQLNAVAGADYTAALAAMPSLAGRIFTANATGSLLTSTAHGFLTGDGPVQLTGTLPTGLALATNYWVIVVDANTWQVATTLANALAGTFQPFTTAGSGTLTATPQGSAASPGLPFTVTGDAPAAWFAISLAVGEESVMTNVVSTTGCSAAQLQADLNAVVTAQSNWYGLTIPFVSQTLVVGAATWAEANSRIFCFSSPETAALASAYSPGSTADTLAALRSAGFTRTVGMYHQDTNQFAGAAWLGVMLPFQPGSATWAFKQLAGVTVSAFTETQRNNLISRNGNGYESVGLSITFQGTCSDGEYADAIVGDDWVHANMQASCFNVLATTPGKVPYEDSGVALLETAISGILTQAQKMGIYAKTPTYTVTVGKVAAQPDSDKGVRLFQDITWVATRSGAIQKLGVRGTVSL